MHWTSVWCCDSSVSQRQLFGFMFFGPHVGSRTPVIFVWSFRMYCLHKSLSDQKLFVGYELRCLSTFPFQKKAQGTGNKAKLMKANTLPAQWILRFSYIWMVNNGNTAPSKKRRKPFAAMADAPLSGPYVSTRYVQAARNTASAPQPKGMPARTGTIQCTHCSGA